MTPEQIAAQLKAADKLRTFDKATRIDEQLAREAGSSYRPIPQEQPRSSQGVTPSSGGQGVRLTPQQKLEMQMRYRSLTGQ